jgi:hypothetical protein
VPEDDSAIIQRDGAIEGSASDDLATGPGSPGVPPAQPQSGPVPWVQAIGAATAFVAVGLGLVYGLGAICIGLRLWYIKDPVAPVLGQLPSSFLLVDAFSELILPVIAVGVAAYLILEFPLQDSWRRALTGIIGRATVRLALFFVVLFLVVPLLAAVPLLFLRLNYGEGGVIRPYWEIWVLCAVLSFLSTYLALRVLTLLREHEQQAQSGGRTRRGGQRSLALSKAGSAGARAGITALALLPCVTFTLAAAAPLPVVYLCGPSFNHVDSSGRHYAYGNLIGVSSQWAYIAETRVNSTGATYIGNYIAVIPLSEVQAQAIGDDSECNNLLPPPKSHG